MASGVNEARLVDHANVPQNIALVVRSGLATMGELQTVYGTEDLYDFLEILAVKSVNEMLMREEN